jgi:DNA-binding transcriptional MerR regulator
MARIILVRVDSKSIPTFEKLLFYCYGKGKGGVMFYTISQVAKKFGLTAHTLRYYDKEGLFPFIERTDSGTRRFKEEDFGAISLIFCLKDTGLPIKQIRQFLDWCQQGDKTIEKRLNLFLQQKKNVEKQIAVLKKHQEKLKYKVWYYKTAKKHGTTAIHKKRKPKQNNRIKK